MIIAAAFYVVSGLGSPWASTVTSHGSFKANRPLKIALAAEGQMAVRGPVIIWVADHRRHHAFSHGEGDPHSPLLLVLLGSSVPALAKGFWHAHMGWIFDRDRSNQQRFAPDLLADRDIVRANSIWVWTIVWMVGPAVIGG